MIPRWVAIALLSAFFTSLRYIQIKSRCGSYPPEIVIFATRLTGAVILLPVVFFHGITVTQPRIFMLATALTVIITAFAVVIQVSLLQREDISRSVPFLSFIPMFMIPWSFVMLGENPKLPAFVGIMLTCAGSYIISPGSKTGLTAPFVSLFRKRTARLMLFVSMCLAFNTVCDKIAIGASTTFSYIYLWTVSSTVVMGIICIRKNSYQKIITGVTDRNVILQSLLWVGGYSCQMFAIKAAFDIPSGTTYVRALTLLNILLTVVLGGTLMREKNLAVKILATLLMVGGAVIIVLSTGSIK